MKLVYVVKNCSYDNHDTIAIFETEELANLYILKFQKKHWPLLVKEFKLFPYLPEEAQ